MRKLNIKDYAYISKLYSEIKNTLKSKNNINLVEKLSLVVNFCVLLEKLIKLRLSVENKLLVYYGKSFNDDFIFGILKDKIPPTSFEAKTKTFNEANNLFNKLFDVFSENEILLLDNIYNIRNAIVHSYFQDNKILDSEENIIKDISTILDKVNSLLEEMFGKEAIASIKIGGEEKYSKEELEEVLREQVRKKILYGRNKRTNYFFDKLSMIKTEEYSFPNNGLSCPACGNYSLEGKDIENNFYPIAVSVFNYKDKDIYICSKCGLQLTKREYEIAKEIKFNI
ncbi:MAG: hypothetical protein WCO35_03150 [Candidatus Nomurabacteria bacterium]